MPPMRAAEWARSETGQHLVQMVGHSSGQACDSADGHCGHSTVYPGSSLLDKPCAGPVEYEEWANHASPPPGCPLQHNHLPGLLLGVGWWGMESSVCPRMFIDNLQM